MSKELAVSVNRSFNRSLSADEQDIVDAISSPKVSSATAQEFRELIAQAAVINAIKDLPSDIEVTMLQSVMNNSYRSTSFKDWQTAFMLNAIGKEWKRVDAFNLFSIAFVSDVLKNYEEYKAKMWRELNKALIETTEPKQIEAAPVNPLQLLEDDVIRWQEGKKIFVEMTAPYNCQKLFRSGIYKKSDWSAEEWATFQGYAEDTVKIKYKKEKRVVLGEHAQREFDNYVKIELSRIVYINIINKKIKGNG